MFTHFYLSFGIVLETTVSPTKQKSKTLPIIKTKWLTPLTHEMEHKPMFLKKSTDGRGKEEERLYLLQPPGHI